MCPFCIGTAAWVAGGAVSAGGVGIGTWIGFRRGVREFLRKKLKLGK
jgi:hypothetical protein